MQEKDVHNKMLQIVPCDNNPAQKWHYDKDSKPLALAALSGYCAEYNTKDGESVVMMPCSGSSAQTWQMVANGSQYMFQVGASQCLTSMKEPGARMGLDPGVDGVAGFVAPCGNPGGWGERIQAFTLHGEAPDSFQISTYQGCMLPVGSGDVKFDAVAF